MKKLMMIMWLCLLFSACDVVYAQTQIAATKNGIRKVEINAYFDSLKFQMPLGLPSYAEDSLRRVGELMSQNDTIKFKGNAGIGRIQFTGGATNQILKHNGRGFVPSTDSSNIGYKYYARAFAYVFPRSLTAVDSETVPIIKVPLVGWIVDSVSFCQNGGTGCTFNWGIISSGGSYQRLLASNLAVSSSGTVFTSSSTLQNATWAGGTRAYPIMTAITSGTVTSMTAIFYYHLTP